VLDKNCVGCHDKARGEGKKAPDLSKGDKRKPGQWFNSYESLKPYTFFWDNAVFDSVPYSTPGRIGARAAKLYAILTKGHYDMKLSPEDMHRLTLWMDSNSDFFGAYDNLQEQLDGKVVLPKIE
jgi:hypothetical protein